MPRNLNTSRWRVAVDPDSPELSTCSTLNESERARLELQARLARDDLGNSGRDRQTAHNIEPDQVVSQEELEAIRLCNRPGTIEAQQAIRDEDKILSWNSIGEETGDLPDINGGQSHRIALRERLDMDHPDRYESGGVGGEIGRNPKISRGTGQGPRRGAGLQHRGRGGFQRNVSSRSSGLSNTRPLDPAIDPNRDYKYSDGRRYEAESATASLRRAHASEVNSPAKGSATPSRSRNPFARPESSQAVGRPVSQAGSVGSAGKRSNGRGRTQNQLGQAYILATPDQDSAFLQSLEGRSRLGGPLVSPTTELNMSSHTIPNTIVAEPVADEASPTIANTRTNGVRGQAARGFIQPAMQLEEPDAFFASLAPKQMSQARASNEISPDPVADRVTATNHYVQPAETEHFSGGLCGPAEEERTDGRLTPVPSVALSLSHASKSVQTVNEETSSNQHTDIQSHQIRNSVMSPSHATQSLLDDDDESVSATNTRLPPPIIPAATITVGGLTYALVQPTSTTSVPAVQSPTRSLPPRQGVAGSIAAESSAPGSVIQNSDHGRNNNVEEVSNLLNATTFRENRTRGNVDITYSIKNKPLNEPNKRPSHVDPRQENNRPTRDGANELGLAGSKWGSTPASSTAPLRDRLRLQTQMLAHRPGLANLVRDLERNGIELADRRSPGDLAIVHPGSLGSPLNPATSQAASHAPSHRSGLSFPLSRSRHYHQISNDSEL